MSRCNIPQAATRLAALLGLALLLPACAEKEHYVIASTGTVIGVEVSQNPATQTPQGKLGYNRAELAIVPTNRGSCVKQNGGAVVCSGQGDGAADTAEVLMELRYSGIFSFGDSSGIYQRLAVGETAVQQPGASVMFAKNASGNVDAQAAAALNAVKTIPKVNVKTSVQKHSMILKFRDLLREDNSAELEKFEAAAIMLGFPRTGQTYTNYPAFRDFAFDKNTTESEIEQVRETLEAQGVKF